MNPYVRVIEEDGIYWFEQNGERFLSLGVNVVQPRDWSTPADGRVYRAPLADDPPAWATNTEARLREWGFTTVAAWSHGAMHEHTAMRYTLVVPFGEWREDDQRLLDVFSDRYAAEVDDVARQHCAPRQTDTRLIGYFLNNELPWYGRYGWPTDAAVSLLSRYLELPDDAPGRQLAEAHAQVHGTGKAAQVKWAGVVADRYYRLCAEAVRRHDPNHLVLGSRFAGRAQVPVMEACGRYCDVVSVNHYSKSGVFDADLMGQIAALTRKPILITEFSWRAMENRSDCRNTRGADVTVATQRDRADCFNRYAEKALRQPYLLGYDWFLYHDQPPGGRFDGEDCNYGLLDLEDRPYEEIVEAITRMNHRAERLHATTTERTPDYEPDRIADVRPFTIRGSDQTLPAPVSLGLEDVTVDSHGDESAGAVARADGATWRLTAAGWGCGVGLAPRRPVSLIGASRLMVRLRAPEGLYLAPSLNESGFGPVDKQVFDGRAGADGEVYVHPGRPTVAGWNEYEFPLRDFERSPYYGNQRGNACVDLQDIEQIGLTFTGGQGREMEVEFGALRFE